MATTSPRLRLRRRTAASWATLNEVLLNGEPGLVINDLGQTTAMKIGDGVTPWADLAFLLPVPGDGGGGPGVSDHGQLTGLGDDDHAQYLTTGRGGALYSLLGHAHAGTYIPVSDKGATNGVAPLVGGVVPAIYLPAHVEEVLEFANLASFPSVGIASVLYVALDTRRVYRWGGSAYAEISPSPGSTDAVPEGAANLYFTAGRVLASALAGLSLGSSSAVTAADSVLVAIGKLQRQLNDLIASGGVAGDPTGSMSLSGAGSILLDGNYLVLV